MKKFILKTIAFVFVLLLAVNTFKLFFPYWWGNKHFYAKMEELSNSAENYNSFFLGSSRVYRHIDPEIFDEIVNRNLPGKIKSYNLGSPGTYNPETYYLFDNFIKAAPKRPEYIFLELQKMDRMTGFAARTSRKRYWVNFKEYLFCLQWYIKNDTLHPKRRNKDIRRYSAAFIENTLGIGELSDMLSLSDNDDGFGIGKNGYYALEDEENDFKGEDIIKRRTTFTADKSMVKRRRNTLRKLFKRIKPDTSCNDVHINRINKIIEFGKKNNINIYFLLIPPGEVDQDLLRTFYNIPEAHRLELVDPNKYPRFYRENIYFDKYHFIKKGARHVTTLLAQKSLKILSSAMAAN